MMKTIKFILQLLFLTGLGNLVTCQPQPDSSEKCLLKKVSMDKGPWLSTHKQTDLEQCVHLCEVKPLIGEIISQSDIVIAVIQVTLQCTAIMYWMTSKNCILYKNGELDSTQNNETISGICPKGTNIDKKWENKGFYCDKNGKTDLNGVHCLMIISI